MQFKKWLLIFLSSFFLNLSLIFESLNFLIFFYLIPVFSLNFKFKNISLKEGFVWGLTFFIIHFYYFWELLKNKTEVSYKFLIYLFVIIYFSFFSGIWFWLIRKLIRFNIFFSLVFSTFIYIYFIHNFVFIIFQHFGGYVFLHPLLPIINSSYSDLILISGVWLPVILLILFQVNLAFYITSKKKKFLFIALFFFIPFLYKNNFIIKNSLDDYAIVNLPEAKNQSPYDYGLQIKDEISRTLKKNPATKIILLPESAFPFALNEYPEIIDWWFDYKKSVHILLGAHRKEENNLFNTVFYLHNNRIIYYYDKTNPMFFAEFIPNLWNYFPFCKNLFLKNCVEFSKGQKEAVFNVEDLKFIPMICSDLFLQKKTKKNYPILFFMNDRWFGSNYFKKLLKSYVKLIEKELKKKILLIAN